MIAKIEKEAFKDKRRYKELKNLIVF